MVWLREVVRGGETTAARRAASDFAKARRTSGWSCAGRAGRQAILPGRAARSDGAARDAQGGKRFCRGAPRERMEPRGMPKADSRTGRQNFTWKRTAQGARRGRPPCAGERTGAPRERMELHGTRRAASDFAGARRASGWSRAGVRKAASDFARARRMSGWSRMGRAGRQAILPRRAARADGAARDAQGGKRFCQGAPRDRMEPHGTRRAASDFAGARRASGWSRAGCPRRIRAQPAKLHLEAHGARRPSGTSSVRRRANRRAARADGAARNAQGGKRFCQGAPRERMEPRGMPKADSRTAGKTSLGSARRKAPVGDALRAPESEPARRAQALRGREGPARSGYRHAFAGSRGTGEPGVQAGRSRDQKGGDALGAPPPAKFRCRSRRVTRAPAAAARARSAPAPTRPSPPTRRAAAGNCHPTAARCRR